MLTGHKVTLTSVCFYLCHLWRGGRPGRCGNVAARPRPRPPRPYLRLTLARNISRAVCLAETRTELCGWVRVRERRVRSSRWTCSSLLRIINNGSVLNKGPARRVRGQWRVTATSSQLLRKWDTLLVKHSTNWIHSRNCRNYFFILGEKLSSTIRFTFTKKK